MPLRKILGWNKLKFNQIKEINESFFHFTDRIKPALSEWKWISPKYRIE